jgi:hypothetical protein
VGICGAFEVRSGQQLPLAQAMERLTPHTVAKLAERALARNIRIGTGRFLNQRCASRADLESILLAETPQNSFATVSPKEQTLSQADRLAERCQAGLLGAITPVLGGLHHQYCRI